MDTSLLGTFFHWKEDSVYFGVVPLQFAACSNCPEIFDLVYSYTSKLPLKKGGGGGGGGGGGVVGTSCMLTGEMNHACLDGVGSEDHEGGGHADRDAAIAHCFGPNAKFRTDDHGDNCDVI
jgi:hypothetical protein